MTQHHAQQVQLRYNTASDGEQLAWRLIIDGTEHLVNSIRVTATCVTTRDWIEEAGTYKHHLTVYNCTVSITDESLDATISDRAGL